MAGKKVASEKKAVVAVVGDVAATIESQPTAIQAKPASKKTFCRFFATKNGCRLGDKCPHEHADAQNAVTLDTTGKGKSGKRGKAVADEPTSAVSNSAASNESDARVNEFYCATCSVACSSKASLQVKFKDFLVC